MMLYLPFDGRSSPSIPFTLNRASPQAKGLVSWWPTLSSVASGAMVQDLATGNHASLTSASLGANGTTGQAIELNGSSSFWTIPDSIRYDNPYVTISGWQRVDSWTGNGAILSRRTAGAGGWTFELSGNPGHIQWFCDVGGFQLCAVTGFSTSVWEHFCCVYDGTTQIGYRNGFSVATNSVTGTLGTGSFTMQAGKNVANGNFLTGALADLRIYNRALSAYEVLALYLPQTRWDLYQPLLPTAYYVPVVAGATVFRTTLSALGTRAGSRQVIG